jgi:dihydrodipicolinate synthase/N-acetylneuraminate lyase
MPRATRTASFRPYCYRFAEDLSIDENSFRKHLRDVAETSDLSAITINAHSTEVASCTLDEQRRVLDIARDEVGGRGRRWKLSCATHGRRNTAIR